MFRLIVRWFRWRRLAALIDLYLWGVINYQQLSDQAERLGIPSERVEHDLRQAWLKRQ